MTALMPRRLGLPARAQISNDDPKASVPQRERYEWLESRLREFRHLEPVNAQRVLEQRLLDEQRNLNLRISPLIVACDPPAIVSRLACRNVQPNQNSDVPPALERDPIPL